MLIYLCHVVMLMPTITIYLTNDLYDKVRDAPSKTVRTALQHYFKDEERAEAAEEPQPPAAESKRTHDPRRNQ
jgi:hypothetical protein